MTVMKGEEQEMTKEFIYVALCGVIPFRFAVILIGSVSWILSVALHWIFVVTELFGKYIQFLGEVLQVQPTDI